jgi:hypothetical protein
MYRRIYSFELFNNIIDLGNQPRLIFNLISDADNDRSVFGPMVLVAAQILANNPFDAISLDSVSGRLCYSNSEFCNFVRGFANNNFTKSASKTVRRPASQ